MFSASRVKLLSVASRISYHSIGRSISGCGDKVGVVVGVYSDEKLMNIKLTSSAATLNQKSNGQLLNQLKLAGVGITKGSGQILYNLHPHFPIVAAVGLGEDQAGINDQEDVDERKDNIRSAAAVGCQLLKSIEVTKVLVEGLGCPEAAAEGSTLGLWMFQKNKRKEKQKKIPEIGLYEASTQEQAEWDRGVVKAEAQNLVRTFSATPANQLTPTIFAEEAKKLLSNVNVDVKIHDKEWAEQKKMGAFLSVSRGSDEKPIFLELIYNGSSNKDSPVVMVGKGVTFDTGGISLKPSKNMDLMRFDMTGGACVLATILAAAKLKIPINVVGLIPLTENMPSGKATKPGDTVFAMNGKSIVVDNTDAEGRLILADALCYAREFKPRFVLDIATLTGAMIVALGGSATGVFTNSTPLFKQLQKAGVSTGDRVWRMPVWNCFTKRMTASPCCDLLNVPKDDGEGGGSCTAAAFLKEFAPEGDWMHLDIAGVVNSNGAAPYLAKGMTGRPTRTLIELLISCSEC